MHASILFPLGSFAILWVYFLQIRMKACAKKALAAALLLVSKCSGIETQDLEALYRKESVGDFFTYEEETREVDLLEHAYMEVECEEAMKAEHNEFQHVLTQIESVAQEEYADDENSDGDGEAPQPVDPDRLLPDGEGLINLTTCADSPSDDAPLPYPKTLEEEGFYEMPNQSETVDVFFGGS